MAGKKKTCLIYGLLPLVSGVIVGFLSGSGNGYESMAKPPLSPPSWVFPVVWTILYILMGISICMILRKEDANEAEAKKAFLLQLVVQWGWPFLFFKWNRCLLAFAWLVGLWILIVQMIKEFAKIDKTAAYLQIPYLIWVTFAGYLNISICFLA